MVDLNPSKNPEPIHLLRGDIVQVLVQAICCRGTSVRDAIVKDAALRDFALQVTEQKRQDRKNGWAKVHSTDKSIIGVINISWDSKTQVLLARVVTRGDGNPSNIIGSFVSFLLTRLPSRVQSISILLPRA